MIGTDSQNLRRNGRQCPYCCVLRGDKHVEWCPSKEARDARAALRRDQETKEDQPS